MSQLSVPVKGRLSPSLRIDPSNPAAQKILNRLSRPSLLSLCLDWLDRDSLPLSAPYIPAAHADDDEESDDFYPPARSPAELRERYAEMQAQKGSKREVVDRIVEGDWRHGLTLYQLAMADLQYLYDHPGSQRWTAYRILPLKSPTDEDVEGDPLKVDKKSLVVPRFHPSTFLRNLHREVLPDVKAHYNIDRPKDRPLLILRIFILDSPYTTHLALAAGGGASANFESSRTLYIAFPDASPFIYISNSQTIGPPEQGETKSLRSLVVEGIPKALSRPRERYALKSTSYSTRNLDALLSSRGAGRTNFAAAGWSIYADEKKIDSPLDTVLPTPPLSDTPSEESKEISLPGRPKRRAASSTSAEERAAKRAKVVAQARFGDSAKVDDGKGVERVDIMLEDPYPEAVPPAEEDDEGEVIVQPRSRPARRSNIDAAFARETGGADAEAAAEEGTWTPNVRLTFRGTHVFAGIRQLVEAGIIDGERMPGWLTGEDGVTIGAVRHGRIRGHKGSGV